MKNRDGKNNPNWRGGKPKCLNCKKLLSDYNTKRCKKCYNFYQIGKRMGNNNPNWKPIKERFLNKINKQNKNKCWDWVGTKDSDGYGKLYFNGKNILVHRFSWELSFGKIPEGMCVLHKCDNSPCVNPNHLFLGTNKDNMRDRDSKNRQVKGNKVGTSKLNEKQVIQIRKLYNKKEKNQYELADMFNVSRGLIGFIVRKEYWKHI